jgi:hypothetical protein
MQGRRFLDLAREVIAGMTEVHWRGAAVHAYYALMLECRDALLRWGFTLPRPPSVHAPLRLRFVYATDPDLKTIGYTLEELILLRNRASYELSSLVQFLSASAAQDAIQKAADTLDLLDQIEQDPARRAAAIASIRP